MNFVLDWCFKESFFKCEIKIGCEKRLYYPGHNLVLFLIELAGPHQVSSDEITKKCEILAQIDFNINGQM